MSTEKEQLIKDAMENYPEAGRGNSLSCTGWDYDKVEFEFFDEETGKKHKVNMASLKEGLNKLLKIIKEGKYFNEGISPNLLSKAYLMDAQDCDALVQCALFGEVRYG